MGPAGNIYVSDQVEDSVFVFDKDGTTMLADLAESDQRFVAAGGGRVEGGHRCGHVEGHASGPGRRVL